MHPLDWAVVAVYLTWIVIDGLRRAKGTHRVDGYFLANRSLPWWAVGLSVMATQMSAVTIVGTTGQAYTTGLRFIQFYFGLPLAMIILVADGRALLYPREGVHGLRIPRATIRRPCAVAGELLFLMGRACSLGVTLAAPVGRDGGHSRLDAARDGAGDLRADDRLHHARWRAGSGLDRRQADVRGGLRDDGGRSRVARGHPAPRRIRSRCCIWRGPLAGCRRSTSASIRARPTPSGQE